MRPPCEIVTQVLLPLVRGLVAQKLTSEMTQKEAAAKMGVSQPTVSSYLKSLKKMETSAFAEYLDNPAVQTLIGKITTQIMNDEPLTTTINSFCSTCVSLRISGATCREHFIQLPDLLHNCRAYLPIAETHVIEERQKVLLDLEKALTLINENPSFVKLLPEVRANLCQSIPHPENINDVAAIPGRITKIRGKAKALLPPEFSVSKHTAKLLLVLKDIQPQLHSAIGIIYNEEIDSAFDQLQIPYQKFSNEFFTTLLTEETCSKTVTKTFINWVIEATQTQSFICIINKGGIGIEPISYLFGINAIELVKKLLQVSASI
jgi:hypothetical protein